MIRDAVIPTFSLGVVVALGALMVPRPADAEPESEPKRAVAVLEYRDGSPALRNAAERVAMILSQKTSLSVLAPKDARQRYGGELDKRVANCAGSARCLRRIGVELGVRELLLIGVSQFGDVILTLQRIDIQTGTVLVRVAEAMASDAAPGDEQFEAYVRRVMPRSDFLRFGTIRIQANLTGATVVVGGQKRGVTPINPIRVRAPATYDIRLDKNGYVPFRISVAVPPDAEVEVKPVLAPSGAMAPAWYKRWWVWAIAGSVLAGTVTVFAATRDSDDKVPVTINPF
ncbi:MAG: PEGA domain-containing protein [Proteobacteria bacterium]|nr:PEGA domain-containing protein [Pseudomonadota bacterium]